MTTFQAPEGSPQAMRHFPFPTCPRRRNERRSRRFAIDWIKPVPSDTMPLVSALLGGAFPKCSGAVGELNALQRQVLARMVNTEELWQIGNLMWTFQTYGLPWDRGKCAELVGVQVTDDEALKALRSG